jgi:hypothetical protein
MAHLAQDPDTTAAVVITDGDIHYPGRPMPDHVLWVVFQSFGSRRFAPGYRQVIHADVDTA